MRNFFKILLVTSCTIAFAVEVDGVEQGQNLPEPGKVTQALIIPQLETSMYNTTTNNPNNLQQDIGHTNATIIENDESATKKNDILVFATPESQRPRYPVENRISGIKLDFSTPVNLKTAERANFTNLISPVSASPIDNQNNRIQIHLTSSNTESVFDAMEDTQLASQLRKLSLNCENCDDNEFVNTALGLCKNICTTKADFYTLMPEFRIVPCSHSVAISSLSKDKVSFLNRISFQFSNKLLVSLLDVAKLLLLKHALWDNKITYRSGRDNTRLLNLSFDIKNEKNKSEITRLNDKFKNMLCECIIKLREHLTRIKNKRNAEKCMNDVQKVVLEAIGPGSTIQHLPWRFKIHENDTDTYTTFGNMLEKEFETFLPKQDTQTNTLEIDEEKQITEGCLVRICDEFAKIIRCKNALSKSINELAQIIEPYAKDKVAQNKKNNFDKNNNISEEMTVYRKLLEKIAEIRKFESNWNTIHDMNELFSPKMLSKKRKGSKYLCFKAKNKTKTASHNLETSTRRGIPNTVKWKRKIIKEGHNLNIGDTHKKGKKHLVKNNHNEKHENTINIQNNKFVIDLEPKGINN